MLFYGRYRVGLRLRQAAVGPFYCPGDRKVYIDLSFFDELQRRFGAPGDFAQAYVIAHEVGHHVQNLLGISARSTQAQQRASEASANELSVRLELQADCLAGVWAHHAAAAAAGARARRRRGGAGRRRRGRRRPHPEATRGYVVPESFTHGSAEQRMRWFKQGLQTGDPNSCDTFSTDRL